MVQRLLVSLTTGLTDRWHQGAWKIHVGRHSRGRGALVYGVGKHISHLLSRCCPGHLSNTCLGTLLRNRRCPPSGHLLGIEVWHTGRDAAVLIPSQHLRQTLQPTHHGVWPDRATSVSHRDMFRARWLCAISNTTPCSLPLPSR